ncbi:MAG: hypothetical protein OMM_10617 [Candidatus Magnetoglobus multicellularis str. Araruama]|jgi:uncharacterized protein YuzE|uniref:DUF2283 domain-containing protein n=1 Tax=Candidatus Magnetoglobus multicellularis str. Araruama TaxID=890399 RepID=A0A1V1P0K0_9BACT|nr:MAG: hypothetical protein OMM_10617 [Candidatus Magnetoglobus multicellularis str. Araruama]
MAHIYKYDEISDTLLILFGTNEKATGIELTDHILLKINKKEQRAVSLTIMDYSLLTQQTHFGSRSFPLTGFSNLSKKLQKITLNIISTTPISNYLLISAFTPSIYEMIPITSLKIGPELDRIN